MRIVNCSVVNKCSQLSKMEDCENVKRREQLESFLIVCQLTQLHILEVDPDSLLVLEAAVVGNNKEILYSTVLDKDLELYTFGAF